MQGGGLRDSFLVDGVAFKKTFSYAGFEMQPKQYEVSAGAGAACCAVLRCASRGGAGGRLGQCGGIGCQPLRVCGLCTPTSLPLHTEVTSYAHSTKEAPTHPRTHPLTHHHHKHAPPSLLHPLIHTTPPISRAGSNAWTPKSCCCTPGLLHT